MKSFFDYDARKLMAPLLVYLTLLCLTVTSVNAQTSLTEAQVRGYRVLTIADKERASLTGEHQVLQEAKGLMEKKKWVELSVLRDRLKQHPLSAYAEYWLLSQTLSQNKLLSSDEQARIDQFNKQYQGSNLQERLSVDRALYHLRQRQFSAIPALAANIPQWTMSGYNCIHLAAALQKGDAARQILSETVFQPTESCYIVFEQLVKQQQLPIEKGIVIVQNLVEQNSIKSATRVARNYFNASEMKLLGGALATPLKWLKTQKELPANKNMRHIYILALGRLAREKDFTAALRYFETEWASQLNAVEKGWVYGQFARISAIRLEGKAYELYTKVSRGTELSMEGHAWRVRSALRQKQIPWKFVAESIEQMTPKQKDESVWVYWLGQAELAQKNTAQANALFKRISHEHSFYGQLALEALGEKTTIPEMAALPTQQEMQKAVSNPSLIRAIWLFNLGWRIEGVREWNFAIRGMNDRDLLAAAHLAYNHTILDRAVNTADRTKQQHNFNLRFVTPFKAEMAVKVKEANLSLSWVYGLIRQESRFIMDARSGVGASGLMQLMPATAKWVAREIKMTDFKPSRVNELDVNLTLGTQYLRMVSEKLDNSPVLASAAYNAGPGRPMKWRASLPATVNAEIFIETIPFDETRGYVQNVLSNATYYEALFTGKPQSLRNRLGKVTPQSATAVNLP